MDGTEIVVSSSGSARLAHIRKFACKPPRRAHLLRLVTAETPPQPLGEWTRDEASDNGEVARDINARLEEHCDEAEADVSALLAWVDESQVSIATKTLNARYSATLDSTLDSVASQLGINGTNQGQYVQWQRHQEMHTVLHMRSFQRMLDLSARQSERLGSTIDKLSRENELLRSERDELKATVLALEGAALVAETGESEVQRAEASAKAKLYEQAGDAFGKAMPFIMANVMKKTA